MRFIQDWEKAICREVGGDYWYPQELGGYAALQKALDFCAMCEMRSDCLEESLQMRDYNGIWGGLTPRQRMQIQSIAESKGIDEALNEGAKLADKNAVDGHGAGVLMQGKKPKRWSGKKNAA